MLTPNVNVILQLSLLVLLSAGVLYVKRFKVNLHGYLLLLTVLLNGFSIATVMIPSAIRIMDGASINSFTLSTGIHSAVGLFVEIIGLYIVIDWYFKKGTSCIRFKNYMRVLAPLWVLLAVFGFYLYFSLYG